MKCKKVLMVCIILLMGLLCSCGKETDKVQGIEDKSEETKVQYISYSKMSALMPNETWVYSSEYLGCDVYEWKEDIILPIPTPEGMTGVEVVDNAFYGLGIGREEWEAYIKKLEEQYIVDVEYSDGYEEKDSCWVTVTDLQHNILTYLSWKEKDYYYNMSNSFSVTVHAGANVKNTKYSNEEVLKVSV